MLLLETLGCRVALAHSFRVLCLPRRVKVLNLHVRDSIKSSIQLTIRNYINMKERGCITSICLFPPWAPLPLRLFCSDEGCSRPSLRHYAGEKVMLPRQPSEYLMGILRLSLYTYSTIIHLQAY